MLPFSIHSKFKASRCLHWCSIRFPFPCSICTVGLETIILHFGSFFKMLHFSMSTSCMIFLDKLVALYSCRNFLPDSYNCREFLPDSYNCRKLLHDIYKLLCESFATTITITNCFVVIKDVDNCLGNCFES